MDPLTVVGAVSAIAGLIDLSKQLCQSLQSMSESFLGAENALQSMQGDVEAMSSSLEQLMTAIETGATKGVEYPAQTKADLMVVIQNCEIPLARLKTILRKFGHYSDLAGSSTSVTSIITIRFRFRWMFEEKNILKIQSALQSHKSSLNVILGLMSK